MHVDRKSIVLCIMELGYLHNRISSHTTLSRHKGFVWQGLVCALREELSTYYHCLSQIHSQVSFIMIVYLKSTCEIQVSTLVE